MREIKFRAYDTHTNEMSPEFALFGEFTLLGAVHAWQDDTVKTKGIPQNRSALLRLNDLQVMQFTGLKDKNGKEIYEGDILNATDCELVGYNQNEYGESEIYADSKGKVHYVGAGFCFDGHSAGDLPLDTFDSDALEVIGNIYENPELLNQGV